MQIGSSQTRQIGSTLDRLLVLRASCILIPLTLKAGFYLWP